MGIARAAVSVLACGLVGCALISGAADLHVAPSDDAAAAAADDAADTATGVIDGADDSIVATLDAGDAPAADCGPEPMPPLGDGGRIREVTFENGTPTGLEGADSTSGMVAMESYSPIDGKYSLRVDSKMQVGSAETDFPALSELYATFLVRFDNINNNPGATPAFARLVPESPILASIDLTLPAAAPGPIGVKIGAAVFGSGGILSQGQVYRIGVHFRRTCEKTVVELFVAAKAAAFGAPVVSATLPDIGRVHALVLGTVTLTTMDMKLGYDDLLLDVLSMPSLSP